MATNRYAEIDEVIGYIQQNIDEPLSLAHLAGQLAYSPFHFTRIFKERIGLSPLYYVSALRLQKAKELLLQTDLSVRDIALEVGHQSLGTFTTRFAERVGLTPAAFRRSASHAESYLRSLKQLRHWPEAQPTIGFHARIEGTIQPEVPFDGCVLIGLFARPIPEGPPLYGTLLPTPGYFCLANVKPGIYYLMATAVGWQMKARDFLVPHATLRTRSKGPIVVTPYTAVPLQQVTLHLPSPGDPPILISLPLLMKNFLNRARQQSNL